MDTENCHLCNADTPYPSVSAESVPSLIDNLTYALYGLITKTVVSGRVNWTIPCDPNSDASIWGYTRNAGEGLMCYFLRVFQSANPAIIPSGTAGQILQSAGGSAFAWANSITPQATTSVIGGFKLASSGSDVSISTASILALSTTGVAAGTFGSPTQWPVITVDSKGRITGTATQPVAITSNQISGISASQVGSGITSAQISGLSASQVGTGLTSAQIVGISASQVGAGLTSAQIVGIPASALPLSGVSAGTYGGTSSVPQVTVDATGRVTGVSNISIVGGGGTVTSIGVASTTLAITNSPVTSSGQVGVNLPASGATAGTYGSANTHPTLAINANGIITGATNQLISIGASQVLPGLTSAQISGISASALPPSGAVAGTYGNTSSVPQVTVDTTGRITGVSSISIVGGGGTVTSIGVASTTLAVTNSPVTSSGQVGVNLQASGVAAATYGSANAIPVLAINANGIVTGATSQIISIGASQVLAGLTSAQITSLSAAQIGAGLTSAQINGLSATQVGTGITSAQIVGLSAAQVGTGLTSAQITGINVTQVGSLGANVSTFLQTPTSANLISAVTDETGTGTIVFSTSPTIATPTINGYTEGTVALGTVGSTATLAITAGTVLTATLSLGLATTFTMPTPAAGKSFSLYLKQPSGGVGSATFTNVKWASASAPTITAQPLVLDILSFVSDGVNWYGSFLQNFTY